MKLKDRVAIVTGAGSGIGKASALPLQGRAEMKLKDRVAIVRGAGSGIGQASALLFRGGLR